VFGSNLAGRHGKGAAAIAHMQYGAIYGQGEGLQGCSYAIATKDGKIRTLNLLQIKRHVDNFLNFAKRHPGVIFKVTAIGTGLAGYKHEDIAPMFYFAPANCVLPTSWREFLPELEGRKFWIS
jgi:hypothetical protein